MIRPLMKADEHRCGGSGKRLISGRLRFCRVRFAIYFLNGQNGGGVRFGRLPIAYRFGLGLEPELLDFQEVRQGPGVVTAKPGFDAMVELEGLLARLRGEVSDCAGNALRLSEELVPGFEGGLLTQHFHVEGSGFGEPVAAHAPVGNGHLLDEAEFDIADGVELPDEVTEEVGPGFGFLIHEEDSVDIAAVLEGIHGRTRFAFGGDGAPGFCSIGTRGRSHCRRSGFGLRGDCGILASHFRGTSVREKEKGGQRYDSRCPPVLIVTCGMVGIREDGWEVIGKIGKILWE